MATSDHVLLLVRKALDEFDDVPLEASVRRAVRIANLVGDTKWTIRLSLDLKTMGGDRETNGAISRMLMEDPSTWGSTTGPAEQAVTAWMNDRKIEGSDKPFGGQPAPLWIPHDSGHTAATGQPSPPTTPRVQPQ